MVGHGATATGVTAVEGMVLAARRPAGRRLPAATTGPDAHAVCSATQVPPGAADEVMLTTGDA